MLAFTVLKMRTMSSITKEIASGPLRTKRFPLQERRILPKCLTEAQNQSRGEQGDVDCGQCVFEDMVKKSSCAQMKTHPAQRRCHDNEGGRSIRVGSSQRFPSGEDLIHVVSVHGAPVTAQGFLRAFMQAQDTSVQAHICGLIREFTQQRS